MQTYKVKLAVITDTQGQVLGTKQIVDEPRPSGEMTVYSRLIAGPGQVKHEIDIELPEAVIRSRDADELHKIVQAALDGRKKR
jgi:hypothetical protein